MTWDRQEAANNAIAAATSTVRLIIGDSTLRNAQIGMPILVHAMIAVRASFLLKMAVLFSGPITRTNAALALPKDLVKYGLNFYTEKILAEIEALVRTLGDVVDNASQQHVASHVVTGLTELLQNFSLGAEINTFVYTRSAESGLLIADTITQNHASDNTTYETHDIGQASNSSFGQANPEAPVTQDNGWIQGTFLDQQQDPFNLLDGDLDWRFNDAFILGIQAEDSYM